MLNNDQYWSDRAYMCAFEKYNFLIYVSVYDEIQLSVSNWTYFCLFWFMLSFSFMLNNLKN